MEVDEDILVEIITEIVLAELNSVSHLQQPKAEKSIDPKEVVIGIGPAYADKVNLTINGLHHKDVLKEIKAGIEEEGMTCRVVKVYKTSDVAFIGKEATEISGSGIGIGLQSKGTAVIHHKDLYPLSNLELFPQAPLMTLAHYRKVGQNAAKYAKSQNVTPVEVINDPMVRSSFQVKAALMHIKENAEINKDLPTVDWNEVI